MEGKRVTMMSGLLVVVVVVLGQIEGGAAVKVCCPSASARSKFNACSGVGQPMVVCAGVNGCGIVAADCPAGWTNDILQYTPSVGAVGLLCCPTAKATRSYKLCLAGRTPYIICLKQAGCTIVDVDRCPNHSTNEIRENMSTVNEYCKLRCVSSVCGVITTLQHSDASEVVNEAVEKCTNACSVFCTKGAVEAA